MLSFSNFVTHDTSHIIWEVKPETSCFFLTILGLDFESAERRTCIYFPKRCINSRIFSHEYSHKLRVHLLRTWNNVERWKCSYSSEVQCEEPQMLIVGTLKYSMVATSEPATPTSRCNFDFDMRTHWLELFLLLIFLELPMRFNFHDIIVTIFVWSRQSLSYHCSCVCLVGRLDSYAIFLFFRCFF